MYRVGQRVDGLYDENTDDMWYPGRIRCVHQADPKTDSADDTFEVLYDDGEVEMNVRLEFLRQHVPGTICVGTRVLCRYDGGDEFYPGQISDVQENGRYTIAYDDGEVEEGVPVDYIMEAEEEEEKTGAEDPSEEPSEIMDNDEPQQQEDAEMVDVKDSRDPVDNEGNCEDYPQDNEENKSDDGGNNEDPDRPPRVEQSYCNEVPQTYQQKEDLPTTTPPEMSAERTYIIESLQQLEKRLGDSASTKSVLSTLVKQMRAYPQVTADLVHERGGERLIIDALKFHQSHAVIQCYGCVLLRRLCFLCVKSTNYLLRNGIVELVIQAMNAFTEDAILQASACGALAVFTRVHAGLNTLIEFQVAQLVLSTLIYHKTYSVHTRQVHYYACEVLLELCELDDLQTLNLLCGEQEEDFTGDMSPISLLLFLLRQGLSLDDKKACCAVGSLLMCLAASGRRAAALILGLNGLAELSTVMARYPTEPSIQKYSSAASKQIALCSVRQSPTKRIKDTATVILREAESIEHTPADKPLPKRGVPRRSTGTGKRKSNPSTGYGASAYSRGTTYSSNTPYRNPPGFSKVSSPYEQSVSGFGDDMNSYGYPVRDFHAAMTTPQQPSSLVILDGNLGADSGFGLTNKRKPLSKEDRQSELFDAYGIQGFRNSTNGRHNGTKRAQLKAHLASAESTWATPQHVPASSNPYSSRSEHFDPGSAYSHQDFIPSRQNRWDNESHNPTYDPEFRQPRGAKRKKKTPSVRTSFQVRVENENQLRVSREAHLPYPSPQRLGAATKRAAKARQKRITATGHSPLTGRLNDASSESLNDYATQLFQDNAPRTGSGISSSSRLTPREKEEIRERERLSFAEKLHKMIDKAKSTLANGSMTSMPTVDTMPRPKKASAGTKTTRRARELSTTPSEEKRPQSKKTRTAVTSTPKHVTKEVITPRDTAETRPAKPTSTGAVKRAAALSDPPPAAVVPRAKPNVSRAVVTPKPTTDQKSRAAIKASKAAPTKPIDKHETERDKESAVDVAPVDVAQLCSEGDKPGQGEADVVAIESVEIAAPATQETVVPVDPKPVEQFEPVVSSSEDVEKVEVPSEVAAESQGEIVHTSNDDGNTGDIPGSDAGVEGIAVVAEDHAPVGVPLSPSQDVATVVETAPEQSESSPDAQQEPSAVSEPTDDQPSGGNATVDAMYNDAYGEFDDNGGDDEMTEAEADVDDTQTLVKETSDPSAPIPLQESKSGEALYDDGYDEFDEDEAPNDEETEEAEVEDAPATEPVDNQNREPLDNITSEPPEIESDSAVKLPEVESEQLAVDETPTVAVEAPTEGGENDKNLPNDTDFGDRGDDVVESSAQALQPNTTDIVNDNNSVDPVVEPCETEDDAHVGQVDAGIDENADIGSHSDGAVGDSTTDEHEAEPDTRASIPTLAVGSATTEHVVSDADPSTDPAVLDDGANPPSHVASIDLASDEVPVISAQPQHTNMEPTEETETSAHPDESLVGNKFVSTPDQDGETKKLPADDSTGSIQSATYDEENFDDEEKHQEADSNEAIEVSPATVAIEEQHEKLSANADEAPVKSEMPTDDACTLDRGVEESKTLAANSSELSVQSNAYEDEDFDDGAQDEAHADHSNYKTSEQEPRGIEVAENDEVNALSEPIAPVDNAHTPLTNDEDDMPKESTAENEPSVDAPENYGDEDFDIAAQDGLPKETTAESLIPESMDENSEPQRLENNESASTPELEAVAEPPVVIAESEAPDTMVHEETEKDQGPLINEPNECDDDTRTDNAVTGTTGESIAEDHVESSDPHTLPIESSSNDLSDKPESEAPESTIPTDAEVTQEEVVENLDASAQPATYDDDEFENGAEEKQATPSVVTEDSRLGPEECQDENTKSEELVAERTEPADDSVGNNIDVPVATEMVSPESQPDQLDKSLPEDARDSSALLDKTEDSVSEVTPEPEVAVVVMSEDVGGQSELPVEDETNVSNIVDNPVSEVSSPEPELQTATSDQDLGQENPTIPEDKADVNSEKEITGNLALAETLPEPETPADKPVEPDDTTTDEPDESVATAEATEEMPDYAQDNDAFDEDTPESNPVVTTADEIPADTSVDATHEEDQYGDAEFDDAETDVAELKNIESKTEPVQCDSSINEETVPMDSASAKDSFPTKTSETEGNETEVRDDGEVPTSNATNDAAEVEVDVSEAKANTNGVEAGDTTADINDDSSASVDQGTKEVTEAEASTKDEAPVSNSDTPAYDNDFPVDPLTEPQEDAAVDPGRTSAEGDSVDNGKAPACNEVPAIDSSTNGEVSALDNNVDDPAQHIDTVPDSTSKDESYDDGFDDDTTAPAIDTNDFSDMVVTSSSPKVNAVANVDADVISVEGVAQDDTDLKTEDQSGNDKLDTTDSVAQDGIDIKTEECDVVDAVEVEPTDKTEKAGPVESAPEGVQPEAVEPGPGEPQCVEPVSEDPETVESEDIMPEAAVVESVESEPVASVVVEPEPDASQTNAADSDLLQSDVVMPKNGENESENAEELGAVEPDKQESQTADPPTVEPQAADPDTIVLDTVSPGATDPDAVETEVTTAVNSASVPESPPESRIDDITPEEATTSKTNEELPINPLEASILSDPVTSNCGDLPVAEVLVEVPAETLTDIIDQSVADDGISSGETKEAAPEVEVASTEKGVINPRLSEKTVEDTSFSIGEAEAEQPADATADEQTEPAQSEAEGTLEIDPPRSDTTSPIEKSDGEANNDPVYLDEHEATGEPQSTDEVIKEDTVEVREEPVESLSADATPSEPAEPVETPTEEAQPIVEDHTSVEPDYAEDNTPEDESPVAAENESTRTEDAEVQEEKPSKLDVSEAPPEESVDQENAEVPEPSEEYAEASEAAKELAIEVKPPQSEVAVEPANATPSAASEGPKTEDQYDDDEAYNEFEEQDNEITTPASPPTVEVPAPVVPAATETATEDDYEEYENDEYGEEENPVETPRAEPVEIPSSSRSEPPVSAREEEIEEVADAPEEAEEEAYADDQDEYNNEYEDDDTPAPAPVPQSSSAGKSTAAEASADEYEDDNDEEDYAEDEVEDSSPKPVPATVTTNKSDDEMEEEVGYESEEYADSDG